MAATTCFGRACSRLRKALGLPWAAKSTAPPSDSQADLESVELSIPTDETQHSPRDHSFAQLQEEVALFEAPHPHPRKNSAPSGLGLPGLAPGHNPADPVTPRFGEACPREAEQGPGLASADRPPAPLAGSPGRSPLALRRALFDEADAALIEQQTQILRAIEQQQQRLQAQKRQEEAEASLLDLQGRASRSQAQLSELGLSQRQIDAIFTNTFDRARLHSADPSQLECNICCTCFEDRAEIKILQCLHKYHKNCTKECQHPSNNFPNRKT